MVRRARTGHFFRNTSLQSQQGVGEIETPSDRSMGRHISSSGVVDGYGAMQLVALLFVLLHVVTASSSLDAPPPDGILSSSRTFFLQNTMMPPLVPQKSSPPQDHLSSLPYMMELYSQYQSRDGLSGYKRRSNTIRSILPSRGTLDRTNVMLFNLSILQPTEKIEGAELHVYKCHSLSRKKNDSLEYEITLFATSPQAQQNLSTIIIPRQSTGWQKLDITEGVVSSKRNRHGNQFILGVRMDVTHGSNGYRKSIQLCIRKMSSQIFLTVFSRERSQAYTGNRARQTLDDTIRKKNISVSVNHSSVKQKRSTVDNELPNFPYSNDVIANSSLKPLRSWTDHKAIDTSIIPLPEPPLKPYKPFSQRKKHCKKRRRKNRKLPIIWQQEQAKKWENVVPLEQTDSHFKGLCQRRNLVVDFGEIGWNEFIIAPQSFDLHFCAGLCNYPISPQFKPSNHATIQSMVHAFGLSPGVPAPCCVPLSLSPVTLLYIEDDDRVVLKDYQNVKVESCTCR